MGIETAIIGSAILGAGASVAGASRSSRAARDATTAQTTSANQNLALQREVYADQRGLQQPFYQAGLQGLYGRNGVMDLMGLSQPQAQPQAQGQAMPGPAPATNAFSQFASGTYGAAPIGPSAPQSGPDFDAYLQANPDVAAAATQALRTPHLRNMGITTPQQWAEYHYNTKGKSEGRQIPQFAPQAQPAQPAQTPAAPVPGTVDTGGGAMGQGGYTGATSVTGVTPGAGSTAAPGSTPEYVDPRTRSLRDTPGYQFQRDEARRGVEQSFAARGKLLSGGAMTALADRSQGLADNTYQTALSNAFGVTNLATGAATNIAGAGQNYASGAGNAFANIGNAQAGGAIGQANAFNQGLQGVSDSIAGGIGMYGGFRGWGGGGSGGAPVSGTYNGINIRR